MRRFGKNPPVFLPVAAAARRFGRAGANAFAGKKPGRGAYLCRNPECLRLARKARRLERAFSCQIPNEVYDRMEEEIGQDET